MNGKMKTLFYLFAFILFIATFCFTEYKNSFYDVLEIISPSEFVIDFNHNKSFEPNEKISLVDIKILPDPKDNLSEEELFIFNELAKNFSKDFLFNKKVQYKNKSVIVKSKNYLEAFNNAGFNFEASPNEYRNLIKYIRENNFYILNLYNYKIHKFECKYALKSENYRLYEEKQLPLKAIKCRLCFKSKEIYKHQETNIIRTISNGDIKVFYTDLTTKLKPDRNCKTDICQTIVSQIDKSKSNIDMAIYGYERIPLIDTAIKSALARGVKVRMVFDLDRSGNSIYKDTKWLATLVKNAKDDNFAELQIKTKYNNNLIMHNKFFIFDNKTVITGSANLSPTDMSGFNTNAAVLIDSPEIARIYSDEFEQMYNNKFHNLKSKKTENSSINLNGNNISVYFSPQDRITENYILPIIRSAKKYIYIPAFLITDKKLSEELVFAKQKGVDVKIILDSVNSHSKYSQIEYLRENGIPVKAENYAGKIHSKLIIIDDNTTILGSMNFSKSGQNYNDENVLIIQSEEITKNLRKMFNHLWSKIDNRWLTKIPRSEGQDSIGSCTDGIDNNYDGKIDLEDDGCRTN